MDGRRYVPSYYCAGKENDKKASYGIHFMTEPLGTHMKFKGTVDCKEGQYYKGEEEAVLRSILHAEENGIHRFDVYTPSERVKSLLDGSFNPEDRMYYDTERAIFYKGEDLRNSGYEFGVHLDKSDSQSVMDLVNDEYSGVPSPVASTHNARPLAPVSYQATVRLANSGDPSREVHEGLDGMSSRFSNRYD